ncbi:MAG: septum formation protein [Desulfobacteraceae bacterium Eth-SRB1]|nr:MAG: septum formation protein [Desulfobacteraceae bacterium Eth-SRB1]
MQKPCDDPILILASRSPRRRYLLEQAGLSFSVIPSSFDEESVSLSSPEIYVKILAEKKADEVSEKHSESWVIGADTVVLIDGIILGKPGSRDEARDMLKRLGGRTHQVLTGYCICCKAKKRCFAETIKTDVLFKDLSDEEIEWYIHTREPFDKAGAYAIQGLGTFLVKSINGSYTNVVGLPVCEVIEFLIKEGVLGCGFFFETKIKKRE